MMPRNAIDMETMELYKRMSGNKDSKNSQACYNLSYGDFCSMCGQHDYEDTTRNVIHKKKTKPYEKHCPSCHCSFERRRCSPLARPKTSENVEAMLNRYERVPTKAINLAIKKSQSSPLSPKAHWHNCQMNSHPRCSRKTLLAHRHRRMKGDTINVEMAGEDIEAYSKYPQRNVSVKDSLKKHNHCRDPEGSPDEQEYSDAESDMSMKYNTQHIQHSRKSTVPHFGSRHCCIGGDGEYIIKNESDVDRQNKHECQEMRKVILGFQEYEKLKPDETVITADNNKRNERREIDIVKAMKSRNANNLLYYVTNKPSVLNKETANKPGKDIVFNCPAQLTKLNLHATKNRIIESIDHVLSTMDDTKKSISQQGQMEQDTIDKIAREIQENGWQYLFNALTIPRDLADSNKRTVRLECLNHMRRELDKLYALESTLENCPPKQSSHDTACDQEQQSQQEQKIAES